MNRRVQTLIASIWLCGWPLAAQAAWNGWIKCVLELRDDPPYYRDTEVHTWFVDAAVNAAGQHTGKWVVTGVGSSVATTSQWTISGENANAMFRLTQNSGTLSITRQGITLKDSTAITWGTGNQGPWKEWNIGGLFPISGPIQGPPINQTMSGSRSINTLFLQIATEKGTDPHSLSDRTPCD